MNTDMELMTNASELRQAIEILQRALARLEVDGNPQGYKMPSTTEPRLLHLIKATFSGERDWDQTRGMVLIATDHHVLYEKSYKTWVPASDAGLILSPNYQPVKGSLEALKMAPFLAIKNGERSKWQTEAGPVSYAELEEWYTTGHLEGKPYPGRAETQIPEGAV